MNDFVFKVGSENKSSTISQISFLKGQRMVFTAAKTAGHTLGLPANLCWSVKSS